MLDIARAMANYISSFSSDFQGLGGGAGTTERERVVLEADGRDAVFFPFHLVDHLAEVRDVRLERLGLGIHPDVGRQFGPGVRFPVRQQIEHLFRFPGRQLVSEQILLGIVCFDGWNDFSPISPKLSNPSSVME